MSRRTRTPPRSETALSSCLDHTWGSGLWPPARHGTSFGSGLRPGLGFGSPTGPAPRSCLPGIVETANTWLRLHFHRVARPAIPFLHPGRGEQTDAFVLLVGDGDVRFDAGVDGVELGAQDCAIGLIDPEASRSRAGRDLRSSPRTWDVPSHGTRSRRPGRPVALAQLEVEATAMTLGQERERQRGRVDVSIDVADVVARPSFMTARACSKASRPPFRKIAARRSSRSRTGLPSRSNTSRNGSQPSPFTSTSRKSDTSVVSSGPPPPRCCTLVLVGLGIRRSFCSYRSSATTDPKLC